MSVRHEVERPQESLGFGLYEATFDYLLEKDQAATRFMNVAERLRERRFGSSIRPLEIKLNDVGEFVAWLSQGSGPRQNEALSAEEAVEIARTYGASGYWTAEQLERFADDDPKSVLLHEAMWYFGYRPHKRTSEKWAKRKDEDMPEHKRGFQIASRTLGEEEVKLLPPPIMESSLVELGQSYSLCADQNGRLFMSLDANPFAGANVDLFVGSRILAEQLGQKGRLDTRQKGYNLRAENLEIPLGNSQFGSRDYVLLIAYNSAGDEIPMLLPARVASGQELVTLLHTINERVEALPKDPIEPSEVEFVVEPKMHRILAIRDTGEAVANFYLSTSNGLGGKPGDLVAWHREVLKTFKQSV